MDIGSPGGRRVPPAQRRGRHEARLFACLLLAPAMGLSGCAAGIVGLALGIGLSSGGRRPEVPPVVSSFDARAIGSPARIEVTFRVEANGSGRLSAVVGYVGLDGEEARPATPLEGGGLPQEIPDGETVAFIWDAGRDLRGATGRLVRVVVTPRRGDVVGNAYHSAPLRAGPNSPVGFAALGEGNKLEFSFREKAIFTNFVLYDPESDRANLAGVEIRLRYDDNYLPLPLDLFDRRDFPTSPAPAGERGSIVLDAGELAGRENIPPEIRGIGAPGFKGDVWMKVSLRDFTDEELTTAEGVFLFDLNDPPVVEILPFEDAFAEGIVPIRYRIFDREENPVRVDVHFDLGDGRRRAEEFPGGISEGQSGLPSLPLEEFGDPTAPFHVFLWDAASQVDRVSGPVSVRVQAGDREDSLEVAGTIPGLAAAALAAPVTQPTRGSGPAGLARGDVDGDGFPDLAVANRDSKDISLFLGGPRGPTFRMLMLLPGGPLALRMGDFDGDSLEDVFVIWRSAGGGLPDGAGFLKGDRSEGLLPVREVDLGEENPSPRALEGGDFDRDGIEDVAVALRDSGVLVLLRGGAGGPERMGAFPAGPSPQALHSSDLDGDGTPELLVANGGTRTVSHFEGDPLRGLVRAGEHTVRLNPVAFCESLLSGDRRVRVLSDAEPGYIIFQATPGGLVNPVTVLTGGRPTDLLADDFDADGSSESFVLYGSAEDVLYVDDGDFHYLSTGRSPGAIARGDFNGDRIPDAAVANAGSGGLSVFLGARGGLRALDEVEVGKEPAALLSGDFDGDRTDDIIAACRGSSTIGWIRGREGGPGRKQAQRLDEPGTASVVADLDRDGSDDLVVLGLTPGVENVFLFKGTPVDLRRGRGSSTSGNGFAVAAGDLDGDGAPEVVSSSAKGIEAFGTSGDGLVLRHEWSLEGLVGELLCGDFDCDGRDEAVASLSGLGKIVVLEVIEEDVPIARELDAGGRSPQALAKGHFDGVDGLDLAVANKLSGSIALFRGAAGGLEFLRSLPAVPRPVGLAAADFNADGLDDLVVSGETEARLVFFPGGPPGPEEGQAVGLEDRPGRLAVADLDADGRPELVVGLQSLGKVGVLRWGAGGPPSWMGLELDGPVGGILTGDFDGDGYEDILASRLGSGTLRRWRGGPSGPVRGGEIAGIEGAFSLEKGDFNGDTFLDVALLSSKTNELIAIFQDAFAPRAGASLDPAKLHDAPAELLDPRSPPDFGLKFPEGSIEEPIRVCLLPAVPFRLLPTAARRSTGSLTAASAAVRVLPDSLRLAVPALLTLRLREAGTPPGEPVPSGLFVFAKADPSSAVEEVAEFEELEFHGGRGVRFPIHRGGTYVVSRENR